MKFAAPFCHLKGSRDPLLLKIIIKTSVLKGFNSEINCNEQEVKI